jgi:protein arginine kinase
VEYENLARDELLVKQPDLLDDKTSRAIGLLRNAHMISSQEALFLLSHLRMGVNMKRISGVSIPVINELFMLTQPAHLQLNSGQKLKPAGRDRLRAEIIRSRLNKN